MEKTSVETIEEQIDFEMSKLEIDFNNGVQWSMRIIHKSLLRIKRKAEQAKEKHKEDCISFADQWEARCNEGNMDSKEQLYDEIYNK
jgi:hypothetical protein